MEFNLHNKKGLKNRGMSELAEEMAKRVPYISVAGMPKIRDFILSWIVDAVAAGYSFKHPRLGTFIPVVKKIKPKVERVKFMRELYPDLVTEEDQRIAAMNLILDKNFKEELKDAVTKLYASEPDSD